MRYILGVAVVAVLASGAHAESSITRDKAIQLAREARELARANRWAEACSKFEASLRTEPTLDRRFELADCYVHIGRLVSAWQLYREASELAERDDDSLRYKRAKRQADDLEPRVPKLVLKAPVSPPAGLVVTRDGTPVDPHAMGHVIYVDPGTYEIVAAAPHFDACKLSVTLAEGQVRTLAIPDLTATFVPPGGLSRTRKYVAIGAGGAGVAAIGAGLLFGWKASSAYNDAKKLCGPEVACAPTDYDRGKELTADARWRATASTVFIVVGGAAIIAAVAVHLTAPHSQEKATARIVPVASDRGAGVVLLGRF
jgi:tetratricopeptide (TPR) repeat protein